MVKNTSPLSLLLILALLLAPLVHGTAMAAVSGGGDDTGHHQEMSGHDGHDHHDAHAEHDPSPDTNDSHSDCSSAGSSIDCCAGCSGCGVPLAVVPGMAGEDRQVLRNSRVPPLPDPHSLIRPPKPSLA